MIAREGVGALVYLHQGSKGLSVEEGKRLTFHREPRKVTKPEHQRKRSVISAWERRS